jgi:hypothetical protein
MRFVQISPSDRIRCCVQYFATGSFVSRFVPKPNLSEETPLGIEPISSLLNRLEDDDLDRSSATCRQHPQHCAGEMDCTSRNEIHERRQLHDGLRG